MDILPVEKETSINNNNLTNKQEDHNQLKAHNPLKTPAIKVDPQSQTTEREEIDNHADAIYEEIVTHHNDESTLETEDHPESDVDCDKDEMDTESHDEQPIPAQSTTDQKVEENTASTIELNDSSHGDNDDNEETALGAVVTCTEPVQ